MGCLLQTSAVDEFVHVLSYLPSYEVLRVQVNKLHNTLQEWRVSCSPAHPLVQLMGEAFSLGGGGLLRLRTASR